ncbi:hypothetical protein N7456_009982 [Penicillium angulare]|uniref:Uncharacterized protein n=1 Tax=Penicillium angulare TaxID=116970 RepID=A0A9W9F5Y5_9EURO|nr:hypothetical protein N7456_009982 [Penicillium angulare]
MPSSCFILLIYNECRGEDQKVCHYNLLNSPGLEIDGGSHLMKQGSCFVEEPQLYATIAKDIKDQSSKFLGA